MNDREPPWSGMPTWAELHAENERLRAALCKARDYIAAEQTLDRPKAATLEIIDRALDGEKG